MPPSRAPHCVSGTNDHGITQFGRDLFGLLDTIGGVAFGHFNIEPVHGLLEGDSILSSLYGIHFNTDHPHAILIKHPALCQLGREIKA
jgi:hypothetical protein